MPNQMANQNQMLKPQGSSIQQKGVDLEAPGMINDMPTYEYNLQELRDEDKPWRKPGADITDYFNYGFNEETWIAYCLKQKRLRAENKTTQAIPLLNHTPQLPPGSSIPTLATNTLGMSAANYGQPPQMNIGMPQPVPLHGMQQQMPPQNQMGFPPQQPQPPPTSMHPNPNLIQAGGPPNLGMPPRPPPQFQPRFQGPPPPGQFQNQLPPHMQQQQRKMDMFGGGGGGGESNDQPPFTVPPPQQQQPGMGMGFNPNWGGNRMQNPNQMPMQRTMMQNMPPHMMQQQFQYPGGMVPPQQHQPPPMGMSQMPPAFGAPGFNQFNRNAPPPAQPPVTTTNASWDKPPTYFY
jgi:hypothetical protein